LVIAAMFFIAGGCRSGGGWNLFARAPAAPAGTGTQPQPPAPSPQQPPGQPPSGASGVVQASYEKPRYVPTSNLKPADLIRNENFEESTGQKKTLLETTTENVAPGELTRKFKKLIGRGPNETLAKAQFEKGEALFRERKYKEAVKCFKVAASRWPDSVLEEDAMYLLAESHFFDDRYKEASDAYAALIKKYENTSYLINIIPRQFAIARYWDLAARVDSHWYPNLTNKTRPLVDASGHAVSVYNSVRLNDPTGPLAPAATMAIANAHFLHNRFEDAAYHYELVRKEFPHSEYITEAHILGIRAKLRCYQGAQYEASSLDDADKLIETTLTQFSPEQLGAERDRLLATRQLIRIERAQREFQAGEYYYKIRYYKAARFYYAETIREFADTPFAKMAEDRMNETKDYPPVPYDYLAWLKKILPESEKSY
jgi:outer membrane protein assembly factor BamD (BamD/ComL family)